MLSGSLSIASMVVEITGVGGWLLWAPEGVVGLLNNYLLCPHQSKLLGTWERVRIGYS